MDPRARRSREALSEAVVEFAAEGRLADVTVSELARKAGVTRDTFYRHASSVPDLLSLAVGEILRDYYKTFWLSPARLQADDVMQAALAALLEHVVAFADLYRTGLSGQTSAPIRRAVTDFLQGQMETGIRLAADLEPFTTEELDDDAISMMAAFAASGIAGSIEVWLEQGDLSDPDAAAKVITAGAPRWWSSIGGRNS